MVKWSRTLATLQVNLGLVPSACRVVHNQMQLQFVGVKSLFWPPQVPGKPTHIQAKQPNLSNKINFRK